MSEASQPVVPAPASPEQRNEDVSADSNTDTGSSGSPRDEDLQRAQILAHARSVATPPATPSTTDEIEIDITSADVKEHARKLYVARREIRPLGLTEQEIADIIHRLEVDLTLALGRIKAKSQRKPWIESMLMIEMRMAGILKRGSTKVTLRPCIWLFCGSKWCQKIVEKDVKALGWLRPYDVHFVRKGGPLLSADEAGSWAEDDRDFREELSAGVPQFPLDHDSSEFYFDDIEDQYASIRSLHGDPSSASPITSQYEVSPLDPTMAYSDLQFPSDSSLLLNCPEVNDSLDTETPPNGPAGYGVSCPTTSVTSSTGYEYETELSGTSSYSGYTGYDTAFVASSSVPSYGSGGSVSDWSDTHSRGTAMSSAPSSQSYRTDVYNSINRQAPPKERYQLPCEFHNLTGCHTVFSGDDFQGWVDHIEEHLRSTFPMKLRCWFCKDRRFDAMETSGGDVRSNFVMRMDHIRDHLVYDGCRPEQMMKDGFLVQHLLDHNLIDRRTYDTIVNPRILPPVPSRFHRNLHSRLPQVEEEVIVQTNQSHHHRSDHWKNQNRGGSHNATRTRDLSDTQSFALPNSSDRKSPSITQSKYRPSKGKGRTRDVDYARSFEYFNLSDWDPLAPGGDYYEPSYTDAYGSSHHPPSTDEELFKTELSWYHSVYAGENAAHVINSAVSSSGSGGNEPVSMVEDHEYKAQHNQHDRPKPNSAKYCGSGIALWGSMELRFHVQSHWLASLMGLSCISTTWSGHTELSRSISKMGGAISITLGGKTSLYGVTSGHGLIHQLMDVAPQSLGGHDSSVDGSSESSDTESEDGEDSSSSYAESSRSGNRTSRDSAVDLSDQTALTTIDHEITVGFIGIGCLLASQRKSQPDEQHEENILSGDLALFPIDSFHRPGLTNYYIEPGSLEAKDMTFISENDVQSTLPVVILLGPEQTVSGTLQPGKFHFSMRGTAIDTRRITLSRDLATGSSGSWVVHDQTLYGMIVAVFPGECMALMVPSKKMMSDIRIMYPGATNISVAIRH